MFYSSTAQRCCNTRYLLWAILKPINSAATFAPMLGILNQKLEARWRGCWSKNIISHDLDILEGGWDIKIDCARKNAYLFDFLTLFSLLASSRLFSESFPAPFVAQTLWKRPLALGVAVRVVTRVAPSPLPSKVTFLG